MATEEPALIINVSLASSDRDYDARVTFLERDLSCANRSLDHFGGIQPPGFS